MEFYRNYSTIILSALIVIIGVLRLFKVIDADSYAFNLAVPVLAGMVLEIELNKFKEKNKKDKQSH